MSNFAIDKLLVLEGDDATYGDGTNAMVEGVRERQIAAAEMMDFMLEIGCGLVSRYYELAVCSFWPSSKGKVEQWHGSSMSAIQDQMASKGRWCVGYCWIVILLRVGIF